MFAKKLFLIRLYGTTTITVRLSAFFIFYFSQPKKFERSSSRCDVTDIVENTSIFGCVYRCSFLFSTLVRGGDVGEVRERKEGKVTREEV